ncbi:tyrosine-type recombinase/integrase [Bradyrhizobium sp. LB11.1]|uniref:tyrosine-type recombinase/integrase n=1 Tax=Bradyrhizobium sp. LB11.1 TaxID=3156326 RepID=UPI0033938040
MAETKLPFISREENRHGTPVVFVRRNGRRIRIHEPEGTPAFARAYAEAVESLGEPPSKRRKPTSDLPVYPKGTLGWLGVQYFASRGKDEFMSLDNDSRRARRNSLEKDCFTVALSDDDPEHMGFCPFKYLSGQKMKRMIEAADGPGARTNRRKHLSALCAWGVENNHLPSNPVRDIKSGRAEATDGYYTWQIPDVQQFLAFHSGAARRSRKARLALGLLLFSGSRRQDMVTLGKQHCRGSVPDQIGDWISYVPKKTIKKRRTMVQKPLLPVLKKIITESWDILGAMTFLITEQGKPFTAAGFGNWFRDRCDEADLQQCTAHGLKKAGATIAAENRATVHELMAMFDWSSPRMAEVYTRKAEQKRLAGGAMGLISLDRIVNEDCRTEPDAVVAHAQKSS